MARLSDAELVAVLVQNSGWRGEQLAQAFAIARRESSGRPEAHNGNAATGDDSYGLFQLNVLGSLRARLATWGLSSPAQLYDPATNVRAAYQLWQSSGWRPWGGYKAAWGFDPFHGTNLEAARAAVAANIAGADTRPVPGVMSNYPDPATAAAAAGAAAAANIGNPIRGRSNNPIGVVGGAVGGVVGGVTSALGNALGFLNPFSSIAEFLAQGLPTLVLFGVLATAGAAIVVLGAWRAVAPTRQTIEQRVSDAAPAAAAIA